MMRQYELVERVQRQGWASDNEEAELGVRCVAAGIRDDGGVLAWLVNTAASAIVGFAVGGIIATLVPLLPFGKGDHDADGDDRDDRDPDAQGGCAVRREHVFGR